MPDLVANKISCYWMSLIDNVQSAAMMGHQLLQACTCILSLILDFWIRLQSLDDLSPRSGFLLRDKVIHRGCSHHGAHCLTSDAGSC